MGHYEIGEIIWHRGDEAVITSEAFVLHGGAFQHATKVEDGKVITVATPRRRESACVATAMAVHSVVEHLRSLGQLVSVPTTDEAEAWTADELAALRATELRAPVS